MSLDPNELLKFLTSLVTMLTGLVTLAAAIISIKRVRLELEQQRLRSEKTQPVPVEILVKLNELEKPDTTKRQVHGFSGLPLTIFETTLSFLKPVAIVKDMPIPESVPKRLRRVSSLVALGSVLIAGPFMSVLAGPPARGVSFVPTMGVLLAILAGFFVSVVIIRIFDRPAA